MMDKRIRSLEEQLLQLTKRINALKISTNKPITDKKQLILWDLETTGLGKTNEIRICEIGLMHYDGSEKKNWYVNPDVSISASAQKVHGLKKAFLDKQPKWKDVGYHTYMKGIKKPLILCGFNSKRYDSRILTFENHRASTPTPDDVYFCDLREVFPRFIDLGLSKKSLQHYHVHVMGKEHNDAHTALGDCEALGNIMRSLPNQKHLYEEIEKKMESNASVLKRCFKSKKLYKQSNTTVH